MTDFFISEHSQSSLLKRLKRNFIQIVCSAVLGLVWLYGSSLLVSRSFQAPWNEFYSAAAMERLVFVLTSVLFLGFTMLNPGIDNEEILENFAFDFSVSVGLVYSIYLGQKYVLLFFVLYPATLIIAILPACLIKLSFPKSKWRLRHSIKIFKYVRGALLIGSLVMVSIYLFSSVFVLKPQSDAFITAADDEISQIDRLFEVYDNLNPKAWDTLSAVEKLELLQIVENHEAELLGRPVCGILAKDLNGNTMGQHDPSKNTITIDRKHLITNPAKEVLTTLYHESRHAQQRYVCGYFDDKGLWDDEIVLTNHYFRSVTAWKSDFDNYPTDTLEEYFESEVEKDARRYAEHMVGILEGVGLFD